MKASRTRPVLLKLGRASTRMWLRKIELPDQGLRRDTETIYSQLADRVAWPPQPALQLHLAFSVLPGAAVYSALREREWSEDAAAEFITSALTAWAIPRRNGIRLLTRSELGRRMFMIIARHSLWAFPAPGWKATWVERSPNRVAFNMTRCFDLDMLRQLGAANIAPAYCAVDDVLYSQLDPQLHWVRTGTLATGATHCDFCFQRPSNPKPPTQPTGRGSSKPESAA